MFVALGFFAFWWVNPDAFVADDSYFYLEIARNIVENGSVTFSGLYPTNGFHPLWLLVLSGYTWVIHLIEPAWLASPRYALPLSGLLLIGGCLLLAELARRVDVAAPLLVVPVLCFLGSFGVLYSEAHLLYVCIAALLVLLTREYRNSTVEAVAIAVGCAALFLARLDTVFVVAAVYLWYLFRSVRWTYAVGSGLLCLMLVAPYLLINVEVFGGLTPVSGYLKSTFPALNLEGFSQDGGMVLTFLRVNVVFGIVPLLAAAIAGVVSRETRTEDRTRYLLLAVAAGVALQLLYTGLFTWGHTNWYWYYVPAVVVGAWSVARLEARWELSRRVRIGSLGLLWVVFIAFSGSRLDDAWPPLTAHTIDFIRTHVPETATVFVSERPGRTAFYTEASLVAADMLTSNRRFYRQMTNTDNALDYIREVCEEEGKPLRYAVYNGGFFVRPGGDELIYFDPRWTTIRRRVIGRLSLGRQVYVGPDSTVRAWDLTD